MRLFYLIQQDHRIRFTPNRLSQLTTFIVAYISRRRSDKTAHRVTLLIFTHIYTGDHILVIEQEFCKRLGKFGLAHAGRTHKQERTDRPFLI